MDAGSADDWHDLADPVPDHPGQFRLRFCASFATQDTGLGRHSLRHQLDREPDLFPDSIRDAKPASGVGRHSDRLGHHCLDDDRNLALLSLGCRRSAALLCLGVAGDLLATIDHGHELGARVIRLGLCCTFRDEPIKFFNTTATAVGKLSRTAALEKLSKLCLANAHALLKALKYCSARGIGCFRVNSQILPLKTHPTLGYAVDELPDAVAIIEQFKACGTFVRQHKLRTCFHPDQFVVLNSQRADVVEASLRELEYQSEVAEWIEADVVNIHGGGAFGDKTRSLLEFARNLDRLSERARSRVTVENDDKIYTPEDLLPICRATGIPLVYDVHHHRCATDTLSIEDATTLAMATWNREPLFHLSSPIEGWSGPKPERHHDYIDRDDFPDCWIGQTLTVEIEAKAKEAAVLKLKQELENPNRKAKE